MDRMTMYRELSKKIIKEHVDISRRQPLPGIEKLLVADDENGHYIWLDLGWRDGERVNSPIIQARVKDGKIWIEENWTDIDIAEELMEAGVPRQDIVLALHPPNMRQYTEFAAA